MNDYIPQMKPWFDEKEKDALIKYMEEGGWLTEFRKTEEFAQMIADYTGTKYCSILSNGTVTLAAALIALGINSIEDDVIVPDYTMIASANSVIMAGAKPVFCDVERETVCMNFESMKSKVNEKTKAIMLVSINGRYPKSMEKFLSYCRAGNIKIIEDAAQSLGSFYQGKHVGTYGDIGSFSFSTPKIITTGQGGALVTNNEELFRKVELVKNFGRENAGIDKHIFYGVNFKFTDLQAVIGIEQMKKLPERVAMKKRSYQIIREKLSNVSEIRFIETYDDATPWFNDILVEDRDSFQSFLKDHKIGSRPFYPAIHTQAPYHFKNETYPIAEYFAKHGLWLPSYTQLTDKEIDHICYTIQKFHKN
jgi:perosamine synthetase